MYKRHDDLQVRTNIYIYKIDRGGTKTMLGPAGALRAPAGKKIGIALKDGTTKDGHKKGID